MNKTHRSIWNSRTQTYVAAAETVAARGKPSSSVRAASAVLVALGGLGGTLVQAQNAPPAPTALPTGGQVSAGQASISSSGANMVIQQSSDRAALNWQTFNVGRDAQVQFQQPGANSVTLNRVMSSDPSQIFGRITANGQVILTNPAGVYFGKDARVDVGGLVATTHGIGDADFMAGKSRFERNGSTGSVVNEGELKAALGGYIALLAPEVRNQGAIIAHMGTVALASGEAVDLHFDSRNRLTSIRVEPSQIQALVDNRHAIEAPGGLIILAAQSMDRLLGGVVKNSGRIEANGLQEQGGRIVLSASHKVDNTGSISANATMGNTAGPAGKVEISAPEVVNSGGISATGSSQHSAGTVLVQATQFTQAATGRIDLSAPLQGGTLTVQTTGKVQLQGQVDVSATQDGPSSQGGVIDVAAQGNIEVTDATLNASGGQGGQIQLRAAAPAQPDNPNPLPDAPNEPGQGRLAMMGNSTLSTRGRSGKGGSTTLLGDHIDLLDNTAIDAAGATGGGNVLVGGDWQGSNGVYQATTVNMAAGVSIDASATQNGDGGKVVLWSDVHHPDGLTTAHGTVLAKGGSNGGNGGQVETSGHSVDIDGFRVNTLAPQGQAGLWLIDPYNYTINSSQAGTIGTALNSSSVTVTTTASNTAYGASTNSGDVGSIIVNNAITKTSGSATTLTLQAHDRVIVNAAISGSSGSPLNVVLWANYGAATNHGVSINAAITTYGGHVWAGGSSTANGSSTWNGLTVGNGASVGSAGGNAIAMDLSGSINTGGGDVLLWAGAGSTVGYNGIGLLGNQSINAGSGNITLLANQLYNWNSTNGTLSVNTTGKLTLAPGNGGKWSNIFNWAGTTSGTTTFTLNNIGGSGQPLAIQNIASLGGLTIGKHEAVGTNTSSVHISSNINIAGPIAVYGDILSMYNSAAIDTSRGNGAVLLEASGAGIDGRYGLSAINAGSGNVTIRSNWVNVANDSNLGFNVTTTGTFAFEPFGTSWTNVGATFDLTGSLASNRFTGSNDAAWLKINNVSSLGGLTLGKLGNTSAIGMDSSWTIAGPISLYGGGLFVNGDLTSTATTGSNVLLQGTGDVLVMGNVQTTGSFSATAGASKTFMMGLNYVTGVGSTISADGGVSINAGTSYLAGNVTTKNTAIRGLLVFSAISDGTQS